MSKRNVKMYAPRTNTPLSRRAGGSRVGGPKAGSSKAGAGKAGTGKAGAGPTSRQARSAGSHSYNRPAQTSPRLPARASLLTIRIAALIIAAASIIGGTAWAASVKGSYTTGVIIGLVLLGFLAGLGLAAAFRTEDIVARVAKLTRR